MWLWILYRTGEGSTFVLSRLEDQSSRQDTLEGSRAAGRAGWYRQTQPQVVHRRTWSSILLSGWQKRFLGTMLYRASSTVYVNL